MNPPGEPNHQAVLDRDLDVALADRDALDVRALAHETVARHRTTQVHGQGRTWWIAAALVLGVGITAWTALDLARRPAAVPPVVPPAVPAQDPVPIAAQDPVPMPVRIMVAEPGRLELRDGNAPERGHHRVGRVLEWRFANQAFREPALLNRDLNRWRDAYLEKRGGDASPTVSIRTDQATSWGDMTRTIDVLMETMLHIEMDELEGTPVVPVRLAVPIADMTLPPMRYAQPHENEEFAVVEVLRDGTVRVDTAKLKRPLDADQRGAADSRLAVAVRTALATAPPKEVAPLPPDAPPAPKHDIGKTPVLILADEGCSWALVQSVMQECTRAGAAPLHIGTSRPE